MDPEGDSDSSPIVVVRLRGRTGLKPDIRATLEMLHIRRKFWATIVEPTPSYAGMLRKVKDYSTYGEVGPETVALLLSRRGRLRRGGRVTDEVVRSESNFGSIWELAEAICSGRLNFHKLRWILPYFRLSPPKGGFKRSTKRGWRAGGELGYRGREIEDLLRRMM